MGVVEASAEQSIRAQSGGRIRPHMQGASDGREKEIGKRKEIKISEKKKYNMETSRREGTTVGGANIQVDLYSLAGCLVEDEDVALAKKCPGKTEKLFLSV